MTKCNAPKISEAELENYICEHPEDLWNGMQIIGRQVRLPSGRLDILGFVEESGDILVIELKVRSIEERDIAQVLRYAYDVNVALTDLYLQTLDKINATESVHRYYATLHGMTIDSMVPNIVLIGPEIALPIYAATQAAGIWVFLWSYHIDRLIFGEPQFEPPHWEYPPSWAKTISTRLFPISCKFSDEDIDELVCGLFAKPVQEK